MDYEDFLNQRANLEAQMITYGLIENLAQEFSQQYPQQQQHLELGYLALLTIAPLYTTEYDTRFNETLYNKLSETGALNDGGLEGLLADEDKIQFANKMFKDSMEEVYGVGEEGAAKYLETSYQAYKSRFEEISQEILTNEMLDDAQKAMTLACVNQVLTASFGYRMQQAQEIYGMLPEKYLQITEYKQAA